MQIFGSEVWLFMVRSNVRIVWRAQLIDATHCANFSAGVWYCKVLRGRSFNCLAIALSFA